MKLAGVLTRSAGYPLDDPPVMVYAALRLALAHCEWRGIKPVGAFEMAMTKTWDGWDADVGLRWEFTPDAESPRPQP